MMAIHKLMCEVLAVAALACLSHAAPAMGEGDRPSTATSPGGSQTARASSQQAESSKHQAGDVDLGLLIIAGAVGFLVLVAWLVARVGDDNRRQTDRTLL